jgi:hypothetical protein
LATIETLSPVELEDTLCANTKMRLMIPVILNPAIVYLFITNIIQLISASPVEIVIPILAAF